jgi:hypothetical protein
MKPINFEIKKLKSFMGNEGYGFNAELWMDGRKAAFVIDDASGGGFQWHWENELLEQKFHDYVKALPVEKLSDDAEDWEKEMYPNGRELNDECFLAAMVDQHCAGTKIKRAVKKSTLFVLPNSKKTYFSIPQPFNPETKARILSNPKNAGAKFINDHLEDGEWVTMIGLRPLPVPTT